MLHQLRNFQRENEQKREQQNWVLDIIERLYMVEMTNTMLMRTNLVCVPGECLFGWIFY